MNDAGEHDGGGGSSRGQQQQPRLPDPGQRIMTEQHVAQRTATECGDTAEQAHAHPVHAAAARRKCRSHRLREIGEDPQRRQQHLFKQNGLVHEFSPAFPLWNLAGS
jgi:hypothetical protein